MVLSCIRNILWDRSTEDIGVANLFGHFMEHVIRGRLGLGRRVGKKGFGIGWEEGGAVGAIETFWKNNQVSTGAGGFEDFGAGMSEIVGFVGA